MALNHICIMGRMTAKPELRQTQNGVSVTSFTLAVDRDFQKGQADFITCVAWRNTADFVTRYFDKGSLTVVSGSLQNREWTDRDGNKRISAEVIAEHVYFGAAKAAAADASAGAAEFDEVDDDAVLPWVN